MGHLRLTLRVYYIVNYSLGAYRVPEVPSDSKHSASSVLSRRVIHILLTSSTTMS
jgi:hypothetical protein